MLAYRGGFRRNTQVFCSLPSFQRKRLLERIGSSLFQLLNNGDKNAKSAAVELSRSDSTGGSGGHTLFLL